MRKAIICSLIALASVSFPSVLVGCAGTDGKPRDAAAIERDRALLAQKIELPFAATPNQALKPLAFLQGRWIRSNPNGTTNEETWSAPYGNSMLGVFRQIRRDGKPALFELSLVTAEATTVELRLRHLHAGLIVPEERKELDLFTLASTTDNSATFAGTGKTEGMRVTYSRTGPAALRQDIDFPEGSREKDFSMDYVLGGEETFSLTPPPPPPARAKPPEAAGAAAPVAK